MTVVDPEAWTVPTREELEALDRMIDLEAGGNGQCAKPALASKVLSEPDLEGLRPPAWLVDGLIPDRGLAQLIGRWGVGKTFISLSWAMSVATESDWHDYPTKGGPVLYIAAEGAHGLLPRIQAWREGHNNSRPADIHFLPQPVNLMNDTQASALAELVGELGPRLVVVDTLARCMVGGDENSAKDMGKVVDRMGRIATDCAVLVVHHPNRAGTNSRGSGALDGAVEVGIVTQSDTPGYLELTCKSTHGGKSPKDAPAFADIALRLDDFGHSLTDQPTDRRSASATAAERIWELLVTPVGRSGMSASAIRETLDMPRSTATHGLNELVKDGRAEKTGSDHRPTYKPIEDQLPFDDD